ALSPEIVIQSPEAVQPMVPGTRPFELTLAAMDAERAEALASGESPDEAPSTWFEHHGWERVLDPDEIEPSGLRELVKERMSLTQGNPLLTILESPEFKRRWQQPDYATEEQ